MKIKVNFLGMMERLTGQRNLELAVQDAATLEVAMHQIGKSFGDKFPPEIWDANLGIFTHRVKLFVDSVETDDLNQRLQDGSELLILVPVAGG
jgi:molybdopterin converting factor small subunit